jgi:hypothetical protein
MANLHSLKGMEWEAGGENEVTPGMVSRASCSLDALT